MPAGTSEPVVKYLGMFLVYSLLQRETIRIEARKSKLQRPNSQLPVLVVRNLKLPAKHNPVYPTALAPMFYKYQNPCSKQKTSLRLAYKRATDEVLHEKGNIY